jgi:DNA-binding beta-propeller fold protein YncE
MVLERIATIALPPHAKEGGFDHAAVDTHRARLYVAHTANDAIDVIDCERARYVESVSGLTGVAGALVSEREGLIFTSNRGENTVGLFGRDDHRVTKIGVGVRPNGLAYDSDRKILLAANVGENAGGSFTVSIVDVGKGILITDIPVPGRTRWAICDPVRHVFYVNILDPPCIVGIDAAALKVVRTFPSPVAGPHGLDLDASRRRLLCACDGGQLLAVAVDSGEVIKSTDLSGVPDVVFFDDSLQRVYIAVGDPGVIDVIDAGDLRRLASVKTELGAHTIGFDASRSTVYAFMPQSHAAAVYKAGR